MQLSRRPLLEREREVASLEALVTAATAGQGRVALVEGPAGIGKTRLLLEARRQASAAGFQVLLARGGELEREFPFGVVRQLFEPVLVDEDDRVWAFSGAATAAQAVFELVGGDGEEPAADPSFASLHGLYWLCVNLSARRPLLVSVDDLQWCDRASLRFLAYFVRRLDGLPVLVACSVRTSEHGTEPATLGEITRDPLAVSIYPHPLSPPAAADLVRERLGQDVDEVFAAACHSATGGNPLLLEELLKALGSEGVSPDAAHADVVSELGTAAVARSVLVRLARLPEEALKVARAAAVLGDGAEVTTAASLAGLSKREARAGAAALVRAEILQAERALEFVHPLVRATVYHELPPPELGLEHERAARLLADGGAPAEQVAAHLLAVPARGEAWVVEKLRTAAAAALRKGALESALAYLSRALEEPPPAEERADVLLELGFAEASTSGPDAVEHLSEALEGLSDPKARALAAQTLGRALLFTDRAAEAAAVAIRAAAELPSNLDGLKHALEALELRTVSFGAGDPEAYRRLTRRRSRPVPAGVGAKMLATVAAREWMFAGGSSKACAELALEALAGGELIAVDDAFLGITAILVLVRADRPEARDAWELSLADAHSRGSLFAKSGISYGRGFTMYRWGELAEAEDSLRSAVEEFTSWGRGQGPGGEIDCAYNLAGVLYERGRPAEARRTLERVGDPGGRSDTARYWLNGHLELLVTEERFEEALVVSDAFSERFAYLRNPFDTPWRQHKALALDALGRHEEALELAREDLELASQWGAPGTMARSLCVLGALEREDGLEHLRRAVAVVAGSPARLEHAKALAALGTALRHTGRPREARGPLRRALQLAEVCGATGLLEQTRTELHTAGGRPRRTALHGVEALTASERRVATLAARGDTNRDIAQKLFVTPKTIEVHLSNAYRKLGIHSRRELPDELAAATT